MSTSFSECTARQRVAGVLDPTAFDEILGPSARVTSPHLAQLGLPAAFDDGLVVGRGRLGGWPVLCAAQEGGFAGGGVGEVHGAKLVGLFRLAMKEHVLGVVLLADSGGVRLHEANAGLIGVSEVMRALLDARVAGVPVIALVGGQGGCFGGMGLVAACADHLVISDVGRLSMSGPEVIESAQGVEEFDSRDRARVWRTTGGRHRFLTGDADRIVADDVDAFRAATMELLGRPRALSLGTLESQQRSLEERVRRFGRCEDARDIWAGLGLASDEVAEAEVPRLRAWRAGAPS